MQIPNEEWKDFSDAVEKGMTKLKQEQTALRSQVIELAQKGGGYRPSGGAGDDTHSRLVKSFSEHLKEFDGLRKSKGSVYVPIEGGFGLKTQIINATGASQPLVAADRESGIIGTAKQALRIRDLIPVNRTTSNVVEFTTQATLTNNARPQGDTSPGGIEGEALAESAMTFTLSSAAVVTIGHWIPASQQVLDDAEALADFVSEYLLYGLRLEEEQEVLTGDGTAGTLSGLTNQATAYNRGATNDTMLDTLAKAKTQLELSNFNASGLVLNPADFLTMVTSKDSQLRYIYGDPKMAAIPTVWGVPIVISNSMTAGKFLMADFRRAARIWDRGDGQVEFTNGYQDYFTRLMVAVRCWERITLTVYRTTALVYGDVSHAG